MLRSKKKRGQSTAEYAILIGVVISAVVAMQMFVGGRLKAKIGDALSYRADPADIIFTSNTFEPPTGASSESITNRFSPIKEEYRGADGGTFTRKIEGDGETTNRTGNMIYWKE